MKQSLPEIIRKIVADQIGEDAITTTTLFSDLSLDRLDEVEIILNIEEQTDVVINYEELNDLGHNCASVAEKLFSLFPEIQDEYNISEAQNKVDTVIGVMKKHKEKPYLKNYWLKGTTELPKQGQKVKWNSVMYYFIGLNPVDNTLAIIQRYDNIPNPKQYYVEDLRPFTETEVDALEAKPLTDKIKLLMSQMNIACEFENLPANVQNSLEVIAEFLIEEDNARL